MYFLSLLRSCGLTGSYSPNRLISYDNVIELFFANTFKSPLKLFLNYLDSFILLALF